MGAPDKAVAEKAAQVKPNIFQRMLAVEKAIGYVRKTEAAPKGLQYNFVSHDRVTAALRPHLIDNGIYMRPFITTTRQDGNRTEIIGGCEFINVDDPEDRITIEGLGYGVDGQDKGPGKAYSYLVKVCMLKAFALETGDREEVDAVQGREADHQPGLISDEQLSDLEALAEEVGANIGAFCKFLKINSLGDLLASEYQRAVTALESKRKAASNQKKETKNG